MKKFLKISKLLLIFVVITAWIFSGWPTIFNFPPKIQEARAAATVVFLTTGTSWTVPADWNNASNSIEVIGGGGGGGGGKTGAGGGSGSGGGGGAYAKISNLSLTPSGSVTIQVGAAGTGGAAGANGTAGTATFFNGTACAGASACGAAGSNGLTSSATGGAGGTTAGSVGTTLFAGGSGGGGSTGSGLKGGGGGGAAGLNGAGNSAAAGPSAGGSGDAGFGGAGGAAGNPGVAGSGGTEYDATHGSGGGGGGGNVKNATATGGTGGAFGAGGGGGGGKAAGGGGNQGLIVITYTPAATLTFVVSTDNFPTLTSGSPVFATTTLSVNTTNATGWNVTLSRDTAAATMALNTDTTVKITDQTDWIPGAATTTAGNAVQISSLINANKVLAFRVMTASGTPSFISSAWWGTTDSYINSATTLWAGIASSTATNLKIGNSSVSCAGANCALNTVLYYLDVASTQQTGAYSGGITYTAVMNP